jgi:hypothetical protein
MNTAQLLGRLSELDLSKERSRLADIEVRGSEINAARERGAQRRIEIQSALGDLRDDRLSGSLAADALLQGESVADLDHHEDDLRSELKALSAALGNLNTRENELHAERDEPRRSASQAVETAIKSHVAALEAEAKEAAERLAAVLGRAIAVGGALRNSSATQLERDLTPAVKALSERRIISNLLPVDAELIEGLVQCESRHVINGRVLSEPIKIHMLN